MSFVAGEVNVICPSCGAPVNVPIHVDWVSATEYSDGTGVVQVQARQQNTVSHRCKRVSL